jgi:Phage ABA sandwich domain
MPERVGALKPGSETDTLVARTVFGLVVKPAQEGLVSKGAGLPDEPGAWKPLKRYSTDDAAANEVLERFRRRFEFREIRDGSDWVVFFGFFSDRDGVPTIKIVVQVRAQTRPLAICEAGLVLVDKLAAGQI